MIAMPFPAVYLALEGTGKATSKSFMLDKYITDTDSQLKFSAMSSDDTVAAVAAMATNARDMTINAKGVGTATITVEARDGDNPALTTTISVTVVRENDRPTTNDLSQLDRDELEMTLYVADGTRTDTVTVVAMPGSTSSESLTDKISDEFKVVVGEDDDGEDDLVTVKVTKGTGNQYTVDVTPKATSLNKGPQSVKIYPMDMFGAASSEAWEFMAMFNTTPKVLTDSIPTIRLTRPADISDLTADPPTLTALTGATSESALETIEIADYFNVASLQRTGSGAPNLDANGLVAANSGATPPTTLADELAKIDKVGDTVCEVSYSTSLVVVQLLNEAGELGRATDATPPVERELVASQLVTSPQALVAIRIDSRFSSLGTGNLVNSPPIADPPPVADAAKVDKVAKGEGAFDITIRCTDKDATAEVTGTVVVQQG